MGKLQLAGRRGPPLAVLSLLMNILLLGCSVFWWLGTRTTGIQLGSTGQRAHAVPVAPGFAACERPVLDERKLGNWGCKVFRQVCFDQANIILHSGEKTPDHPKFTPDILFKAVNYPPYVLPGYAEALGNAHFAPKSWDINIRGPTPYDPPDVWRPREFTNCTVPLVWWLTYFSVFSDLYIGSAIALDGMLHDKAFDRNVTLAPVSLGMDMAPMHEALLGGVYTRHKVVSLSALSSREHMITGQPRCFERAVLCNMVGMYASTSEHSWLEFKPKQAGRRAVEFLRREHAEEFAPVDKQAAQENGTVFRVAFMPRSNGMRVIRNLDQVMDECKKWQPPADTKYKTVDCVALPDGTAENHVKLVAHMQNVHALVNTHGSGNTYGFFMPNGTGLVEILSWNFHGGGCTWASQYFRDWYDLDHTVDSGYFRLVADKDHVFPGPFERNNSGSNIAYGRDKDVVVDFPTLAKALDRIARGELHSVVRNRNQRVFFMTRKDLCPSHLEWLKTHAMGDDEEDDFPRELQE